MLGMVWSQDLNLQGVAITCSTMSYVINISPLLFG